MHGWSCCILALTFHEIIDLPISNRGVVMTARPGKIKATVGIDLPRPRSSEVIGLEKFGRYVEVRYRQSGRGDLFKNTSFQHRRNDRENYISPVSTDETVEAFERESANGRKDSPLLNIENIV